MATAGEVRLHADRYGILLTHGTFHTTGLQLSSASMVLPFICSQQGILWAAGLLYPAYSIGVIFGNAMSPVILERSRNLKHLVVAAAGLTIATLIGCNTIAAVTGTGIAAVFLATSLATGVANGLWKVAFSDVLSSKLTEMRRGDLLLNQGAFGALLAIVSTLMLVPLIDRRDPASSYVDLLWLGAAGMVVAGIASLFVGPVHPKSVAAARRLRDTYREGMVVARTHQWFRRYAVTRLMFVPISLGSTFFSLHAAQQHGTEPGGLHILVISMSVGLIAGSFLWRIVYRSSFGVRGMLLLSALIGCAAAGICILAEVFDAWSHVWVHGFVILLATVANQAILAASISWINVYAADHQRATLIGFAAVLVAVETALLGAILGGIAQKASAIWPVVIVLLLNLAAAVAALRAPTRA